MNREGTDFHYFPFVPFPSPTLQPSCSQLGENGLKVSQTLKTFRPKRQLY
jgi:hypothetical protein